MRSQEIDKKINQILLKAEFGIEKESLRVNAYGYLADTDHPKLGSPQISRDFGESQVEFISGVHDNLTDTCMEICSLQWMVEEAILKRQTGAEYMWTYSNPPLFLGEESIKIAEFEGASKNKTTYRSYLSQKYGKVKMLYSGVHLNYSMPRQFFKLLQKKYDGIRFSKLKSEWYVRLCDALMSDSWLIVALTAASPVADSSFLTGLGVPKQEWESYATFRNSKYGYWNLFLPELSYRDFHSYLKSMESYVKQKEIDSIQELYYPIRIKPKGENTLSNLRRLGANHIELRMLDLNPMCCAGVEKRDLIFLNLLIAYRTAELLNGKTDAWQTKTDAERLLLHQEAAKLSFWEEKGACREYACDLIDRMKEFFCAYEKEPDVFLPKDYSGLEVLEFEKQKILEPDMRYANRILETYKEDYIGARMREMIAV